MATFNFSRNSRRVRAATMAARTIVNARQDGRYAMARREEAWVRSIADALIIDAAIVIINNDAEAARRYGRPIR